MIDAGTFSTSRQISLERSDGFSLNNAAIRSFVFFGFGIDRKRLATVMLKIFSRTRVDSVFGEIEFGRTFGVIGAGFWGGQVMFQHLKKKVTIRIASGRAGPTSTQRQFYRELETRYPDLIDNISDLVVDAPSSYFDPDFFGKYVPALEWKDFELDAIGIGRSEPVQNWWLSYRLMSIDQSFSVSFEGWTPKEAELDD